MVHEQQPGKSVDLRRRQLLQMALYSPLVALATPFLGTGRVVAAPIIPGTSRNSITPLTTEVLNFENRAGSGPLSKEGADEGLALARRVFMGSSVASDIGNVGNVDFFVVAERLPENEAGDIRGKIEGKDQGLLSHPLVKKVQDDYAGFEPSFVDAAAILRTAMLDPQGALTLDAQPPRFFISLPVINHQPIDRPAYSSPDAQPSSATPAIKLRSKAVEAMLTISLRDSRENLDPEFVRVIEVMGKKDLNSPDASIVVSGRQSNFGSVYSMKSENPRRGATTFDREFDLITRGHLATQVHKDHELPYMYLNTEYEVTPTRRDDFNMDGVDDANYQAVLSQMQLSQAQLISMYRSSSVVKFFERFGTALLGPDQPKEDRIIFGIKNLTPRLGNIFKSAYEPGESSREFGSQMNWDQLKAYSPQIRDSGA